MRQEAGVRGGDGIEHLAARALRLASPRASEPTARWPATLRQEHDLAREHGLGWDGGFYGSRGRSEDGAVFETYLREALLPALNEGDVLVMDNLRVHKSERVRELIERAGVEVLYLPPYSPDFKVR